jgi:hypothetical protein
MKTAIVLAMHGAPPNDVSPREAIELVGLHEGLGHKLAEQLRMTADGRRPSAEAEKNAPPSW